MISFRANPNPVVNQNETKGTNEILSSNAKEVLNKTNKTAMVVDSIDKFEKSDNKMQTAKELFVPYVVNNALSSNPLLNTMYVGYNVANNNISKADAAKIVAINSISNPYD